MSNTLSVRPSMVQPVVLRAIKAKRPIFIWGPPGIGKSEIVEHITYNMLPGNNLMIDLRLALMEPTDMRGYPFRNPETNKMEWSPPVDLPDAETAAMYDYIVLFLDELNSAPSSVQAAAYQLVLNGRIGQYVLPENVRIIAAGNRDTDRGVTYRMPSPLANRFRHVNMEVNFEDYQQWAITHNIHPDVIGYLSYAKQDLFDFDPKSSSQAFATPRSWTSVSDSLYVEDFKDVDQKEQMVEVAGSVGEGMAIKFIEHRKVAAYLPAPEDVLDAKVTKLESRVAKEISAKYSLVAGVTYEFNARYNDGGITKTLEKSFNNIVKFAFDNFEPEMVVLLLKTIMKDYKIAINFRQVLDKELLKIFNEKYIKYIV